MIARSARLEVTGYASTLAFGITPFPDFDQARRITPRAQRAAPMLVTLPSDRMAGHST